MNRITPDFAQHLDSGTRAVITSAYSDALVPIFLYVVPLLVVGFVLMLTLKGAPAGHEGELHRPPWRHGVERDINLPAQLPEGQCSWRRPR